MRLELCFWPRSRACWSGGLPAAGRDAAGCGAGLPGPGRLPDESVPGASLEPAPGLRRRTSGTRSRPPSRPRWKSGGRSWSRAYRKQEPGSRPGRRFDEAEAILKDLAPLENERAGKLAGNSWPSTSSTSRPRACRCGHRGAQAVARALRNRPLTVNRRRRPSVADVASMVDVAEALRRRPAFQAAACCFRCFSAPSTPRSGRVPAVLYAGLPGARRTARQRPRRGRGHRGLRSQPGRASSSRGRSERRAPGSRTVASTPRAEGPGAAAPERAPRRADQPPRPDPHADPAGAVDAGVRMTRATRRKAAARSLQLLLHGIYAEEGRYPGPLALTPRRSRRCAATASSAGSRPSRTTRPAGCVPVRPQGGTRASGSPVTESTIEEVGALHATVTRASRREEPGASRSSVL